MDRNKTIRVVVALFLIVPFFLLSFATSHSRDHQTALGNSQGHFSSVELTESRFSREQWNLTETEWGRYLSLMRGVRGSISPNTISPIEVLGVHARSEEERMKYARKWADIMREDAERVLAFQVAYDTAWREINPSGEIIDLNRLPQSSPVDQNAVQTGDRVLLFLRIKACPECQGLYTNVRRAAYEAGIQLDIFFTDTKPGKDDTALREWIAKNRFDKGRLKSKKVTFNHDDGVLSRIGGATTVVPAAFRIRNKLIEPIHIGMPGL